MTTHQEDTFLTFHAPLGTAQHLPPGALIAIVWSAALLIGVFVAARTILRITRTEHLRWDDYWLYFAYIIALLACVLGTLQTSHVYYIQRAGAGLHPFGGKEFDFHWKRYSQYQLALSVLFWTVLWSVKASFLALYLRMFQGLGHYRKWWKAVAIFTLLSYVGCWIASINVCYPLGGNYNNNEMCLSSFLPGNYILIRYGTAVDVLTDTMIMLLPLHMLYKVRLATKQKLGLAVVFSLGIIIIIVAIARASHIGRKDFTDGILLFIWSIIENSVAVIVGCLPPFKTLFHGRRGSSNDRDIGASDLLPLRPYRGAIRMQTNETNIEAKPRPTLFGSMICWLGNIRNLHRSGKATPTCPDRVIQVRSDVEVKNHGRGRTTPF